MTKKNTILNKKFSSKEIMFLKSDSDSENHVDSVPEEYLLDNIFSDPLWMEVFLKKLEQTEIPGEKFLCAVIKQSFPLEANIKKSAKKNTKQKIRQEADAFLSKLSQKKHGLWDRINNNIFVIVMGYQDIKSDEDIISLIRQNLNKISNASVSIGLAKFPFLDFTKKDTFYNAVKALDHGAFLGQESTVFFDAVSLNISGDRLYHMGKIKKAACEYKKGLEIENDNINLTNSLGVCFGMMQKLEQARKEFEKAMAIDNNEFMAVYNTGLIYEIMNKREKALKYLCKASLINDHIFEVELTTGKLFYMEKKFEQALYHLQKAIKLNEKAGAPLKISGDLFLEKGLYEKAVQFYKKAIKLNPLDAGALSGLAAAFEIQNKNLDIALGFARQSVSMEPYNPVFRSRLKRLYSKKETNNLVHIEFEKSNT